MAASLLECKALRIVSELLSALSGFKTVGIVPQSPRLFGSIAVLIKLANIIWPLLDSRMRYIVLLHKRLWYITTILKTSL